MAAFMTMNWWKPCSVLPKNNGTGDTRWKVPGVLDWSTGVYNPRVDITKDTTTLYASDRDVFLFLVDDLNRSKLVVCRTDHRICISGGSIAGTRKSAPRRSAWQFLLPPGRLSEPHHVGR